MSTLLDLSSFLYLRECSNSGRTKRAIAGLIPLISVDGAFVWLEEIKGLTEICAIEYDRDTDKWNKFYTCSAVTSPDGEEVFWKKDESFKGLVSLKKNSKNSYEAETKVSVNSESDIWINEKHKVMPLKNVITSMLKGEEIQINF